MQIKKESKDEKSSSATINDATNVTEKDKASACSDNNDAKPKPKSCNSNLKCYFPRCTSASKEKDLKWFGAPQKIACPPQSKSRFAQVRKLHIKNKTRFVLTDKLGRKSKELMQPRWHSKHFAAKPLKTKVSFMHNGKNHSETFDVYPVPDPSGHKIAVSSNLGDLSKGKGVEAD